ncbi:MAG: hypothetical protein ABIU54_07820 [Candidatus Eisenbacteria bacterium]
MPVRSFKTVAISKLATACCVLALLSCVRSPLAPEGRLQVYVSENGAGPAPGKRIEIQGTSLSQTTDKNGLALFTMRPGNYVVRAYEIGTPGPGFPFVEQSVEVVSARTSQARFTDCTMCDSPSR